MYNIPTPPTLKDAVMGLKPGRRCKFPRVKVHLIEDFYQLRKEIEKLIHERHLKKYVKGNSSNPVERSSSHGQESSKSPESYKTKETSQSEGSKVAQHTLNT